MVKKKRKETNQQEMVREKMEEDESAHLEIGINNYIEDNSLVIVFAMRT